MKLMLVDDEALVLNALRRVIVGRIADVDVRTFPDAGSALLALQAEPFDLLLTDMRMPGMDGARLLELAHERRPDLVRVVLSGHMDSGAARRAAQHAHHLMAKPCSNDALEDVVRRAGSLRLLFADEAVRGAIAGLGGSGPPPALPPAFQALVNTLDDARVATSDLADLVVADPALHAHVLALASEPPFGPQTGAVVVDVEVAVKRMGTLALKAIVLFHSLLSTTRALAATSGVAASVNLDHLAATAERRALLTMQLGDSPAECYAAGLLADVGRLVTAVTSPLAVDAVSARVDAGEAREDLERALLGTTHAEVGAYLLGIFCMPLPVVEAVRGHHAPRTVRGGEARLTAACCAAAGAVDGTPASHASLAALLGDADAASMLERARCA